MFGIINLPAFILAAILLILTPGADTMYIVGRSMAQGKKAGIYSALGISTGILCHTTFVAFGLSLIVARSAMAFDVIKYAGAVYLVYLGVKMALARPDIKFEADKRRVSTRKLYASGVLTNVLNPKVALFFLVFLPQFVKTSYAHSPLPFIILGVIFVIPGTVWSIILAISSAKLSGTISQNSKITLWLNRITGGVFIGLGLKLALIGRR
jgi:threonine/homoserine/homoserine lactone efflux protein